MKTGGHAIDPLYYYSLTLFSFNGSTMLSKKVYIFSGVKNQLIIGKLTAVAAIKKKKKRNNKKNSWFRDTILPDVVRSQE